jgi:hypothetical protein
MAAGDVLLDDDGNVILDDDGNVLLSDGADDDCCCGEAQLYTQARLCETDDLVNLWVVGEQPVRGYAVRQTDGLCYYFDPADVGAGGPLFDYSTDPAGSPLESCEDARCVPCEYCLDAQPNSVNISISGSSWCGPCFAVQGTKGTVTGSADGTYGLTKDGDCSWRTTVNVGTIQLFADADCLTPGGVYDIEMTIDVNRILIGATRHWDVVIFLTCYEVGNPSNNFFGAFFTNGPLAASNCRGERAVTADAFACTNPINNPLGGAGSITLIVG